MIPGSGAWRARETATSAPVTGPLFSAHDPSACPAVPGPSKFQLRDNVALSVTVSIFTELTGTLLSALSTVVSGSL